MDDILDEEPPEGWEEDNEGIIWLYSCKQYYLFYYFKYFQILMIDQSGNK